MLQKTLLLSVAQLLALSTAVSIPSPVLTDPEAEADRAEVAGLMRTEFYKGAEYYYLFVTNEYSGSKLLRQSICDVYTDPKTELSEGVSFFITASDCQISLCFTFPFFSNSVHRFFFVVLFFTDFHLRLTVLSLGAMSGYMADAVY